MLFQYFVMLCVARRYWRKDKKKFDIVSSFKVILFSTYLVIAAKLILRLLLPKFFSRNDCNARQYYDSKV